jgi:acyl carrier protein
MTTATGYEFPAQLFDCLQVNLAERAEFWHGPGTAVRLGAMLRFRPTPGPSGLPTVERTPEQQLEEARHCLGLAVREVHSNCSADEILPGEGRYVVADAFSLPWVPYHRRQHMDHSFLLLPGEGGDVRVQDSYLNETPWGSARPGVWRIGADAFTEAETVGLSVDLVAAEPFPLPRAVPLVDLADEDETDAYLTAYERHPDRSAALHRLALETWLLSRSRELHAAFLQQYADGGVTDRLPAHVASWKALTEQVYLAYRRVERGRQEPTGPLRRLRQLLHEDSRVFARSEVVQAARPDTASTGTRRSASGRTAEDPRAAVASVAAEVLGADPAALLAGASLSDLPGFNSFRIVEMVERLEERFRIEFRADDLVPENLRHVDDVCRAVARALPASPSLTTARVESAR